MVAVTLRPITTSDWGRIHEWAASPLACRYQPWGPNEAGETQAFVDEAIRAWAEMDLSRRVWVAEVPDLGVVGLGELKVRSRVHLQAEILCRPYGVLGPWLRRCHRWSPHRRCPRTGHASHLRNL